MLRFEVFEVRASIAKYFKSSNYYKQHRKRKNEVQNVNEREMINTH